MEAGPAWEKIAGVIGVDPKEYPLYLGKGCGVTITLNEEGVKFDYQGFRREVKV